MNKNALPADDKNDTLTRIKQFMSSEESGVVLTPAEEKILTRWTRAHSMLQEKKFSREEIAEKIKQYYNVSIYTARSDIDNAYSLFVSVTQDYQRYSLFYQVEYIDKLLAKAEVDKSMLQMIPKLLAERTRAIAAMPVKITGPDLPAPVINLFGVFYNQTQPESKQNISSLLDEADKLIEFERNHEYAEFTDIKDEPTGDS